MHRGPCRTWRALLQCSAEEKKEDAKRQSVCRTSASQPPGTRAYYLGGTCLLQVRERRSGAMFLCIEFHRARKMLFFFIIAAWSVRSRPIGGPASKKKIVASDAHGWLAPLAGLGEVFPWAATCLLAPLGPKPGVCRGPQTPAQ